MMYSKKKEVLLYINYDLIKKLTSFPRPFLGSVFYYFILFLSIAAGDEEGLGMKLDKNSSTVGQMFQSDSCMYTHAFIYI